MGMPIPSRFIQKLAENLRCPQQGFIGWCTKALLKKRNMYLERCAVDLCRIDQNHRVLEVGFGTGGGIEFAYNKVKDGTGCIHGADYSLSCVDSATRRFRQQMSDGKVDIVFADVKQLPYASHYFDTIFHVNCFYFWPDTLMAAAELFRCVKPGGPVISTLNLNRLKAGKEKGYLVNCNTDPVHYMHCMEAVGFTDVHMDYLKDTVSGMDYQCISALAPLSQPSLPQNESNNHDGN